LDQNITFMSEVGLYMYGSLGIYSVRCCLTTLYHNKND